MVLVDFSNEFSPTDEIMLVKDEQHSYTEVAIQRIITMMRIGSKVMRQFIPSRVEFPIFKVFKVRTDLDYVTN